MARQHEIHQKKGPNIWGFWQKGLQMIAKRGGVDVRIAEVDGNYSNFGQLWTDSSLEFQVLFFIMRHTFLWDNQYLGKDHPHRMGSGNLCNRCIFLGSAR